MSYAGDITEDTTGYNFKFTSRNTTGQPHALASGDIDVYRDGTTTPTTAGATLTSTFAEVVGLNFVTIDLSASTFYSGGSNYSIVMSAGTVNSVSIIGEVVNEFSIDNRAVSSGTLLDIATTALETHGASTITSTDITDELNTYGGTTLGTTEFVDAATTALETAGVSTHTVSEVSSAVWDEVLTGATHAVADSAGRRLRDLQEFGTYEDGAVWIDTVNGTAGTTPYESGTAFNPVKAMADVNSLLAALNLGRVHVAPGSSVVFAASQDNQVFVGDSWALALGGQSIDGTSIIGAMVTGIATNATGEQFFTDCTLGAVTLPNDTHVITSGVSGTHTMGEVGDYFYDRCHSAIAGSGSVTIDFASPAAETNLNIRHHSGGWTVENMGAGAGTCNATFEGNGQIIWAASCVATSNASIRGNWEVTDNASGAVTEALDDNQETVNAIFVDTDTTIPATLSNLSTLGSTEVDDSLNSYGASTLGTTEYVDAATTALETHGASTITSTDVDDSFTSYGPSTHTTTDIDDSLATYDGPTNTEMEARTPTAAQLLYMTRHAAQALPFTVASGSTSTIVFALVDGSAGSTKDDAYNNRVVIFDDGSLENQAAEITDYDGATVTATISEVTNTVSSTHTGIVV